ncbi:MAG: hypothetical protein U9N61_02800 [Euryarchaeota archaeon]|nr:hypothetical protein [Euryarchaeota archaeon]
MIYKYIGNGKGWPHIPARDLTKADLERIKKRYSVDEKEIKESGLYKKQPVKKKSEAENE